MLGGLARKLPKAFQSRRFALSLVGVVGFLQIIRTFQINSRGVARADDWDTNSDDDVEKWINDAKVLPPDGQSPDDDDEEVLNWNAPPVINEEDEEREDDGPYLAKNSQKNSTKKKILLLAYARSGSSFAGDLLSASAGTSYFFEPLYSLKPNGFSIERVLAEDPSKVNLVQSFMSGIFNCNPRFLNKIHRKRGMKCSSSNLRVVKTIRLHRVGLEPWIYQSGIKIVHLIRDPRGVISSMAKKPGTWGETSRNPTYLCDKMMEDLQIASKMPQDSYIRVKYEDLATKTTSTLRAVYSFLGISYSDHVAKEVYRHTHSGNNTAANNKYYGTFRAKYFNPNSWKAKLSMKAIRNIERSCAEFLRMTGYEVYQPPARPKS